MNKRLIMLMAAALALLSARGQVTFAGGSVDEHSVIVETLSTNHGSLNKIFVVYNTDGVKMTYHAETDSMVVWQTYDSETWATPQVIPNVRHEGSATTLDEVIPNTGYIIYEGTTPFYCWVVNYADYYMQLSAISTNSEPSCNLVSFSIDGQANAIPYYNIDGRRQVLDRQIKLTYNTLVWDDSTHWQEEPVEELFAALDQTVEVEAPLCNTVFMMSGDRFLEEWGMPLRKETDTYVTTAVQCGAVVEQENRGNDNERGLDSGYGGSAPVHIVFTGYPTDAAVHCRWEMATDEEFENVVPFNQDEVDYVFNDFGTYFMRYVAANADGSCEAYSDTYTITVSESWLPEPWECPNVFSPGSTEGVNDVWQLPYKSIAEFHCWIYNRWGTLMYEYTDPGGGWDGTYNGRLVDTGVYFYVVTAVGTDGVSYKRRGDITILRYKKGAEGTSQGDGAGGIAY